MFFFYQVFLSKTLTILRTAEERSGPSFLPLYHIHPLTSIQTFLCNFACEVIVTCFNCTTCIYQTATRWDLPPYRITIWLIYWWCNVCLFTWWIESRFLLQRFWYLYFTTNMQLWWRRIYILPLIYMRRWKFNYALLLIYITWWNLLIFYW